MLSDFLPPFHDMPSPGGVTSPQEDPPEAAKVYKIFRGLKRTPTKKTGGLTGKVRTPVKRVHSPEEDAKTKREKLLVHETANEQCSEEPKEETSPPQETRKEPPQETSLLLETTGGTQETVKRTENGTGSHPLQELVRILDSLARLAKGPKSSQMSELITKARDIVTALKDRKSVDAGTETDFKEIQKLRWKDRVDGGTPREQWSSLCEEHWPPEAYSRTTIVGPHPVNQPGTTSLILCRRTQISGPEGESLRQSLPALTRMNHETVPRIVKICSTETIDGMESVNSNVFLMSLDPEADTEADTEAVISAFEDLRSKTDGLKGNIIVTTLTGGAVARKAIELVFTGTEVTWSLTTRKNKLSKPPTETLVVSTNDMTYAQLVKSCKENVVADELGVRVLNIKQNQAGDMEMRVSGKVKALKEKIQERVPGVTMAEKRKTTIMHIRDLEEEVTKEEIIEGLKRGLKNDQLQPSVTSIRPAYDNTCRATVKLDKESAVILSKKGFVQVGLISARIRIREEKPRCHKCKEEGHIMANCKSVKPDACFRCKEVGHFKANCPVTHSKND